MQTIDPARQKMLDGLRKRAEAWGAKLDDRWPFDNFRKAAVRELLRDFILSDSMDIAEYWTAYRQGKVECPSLRWELRNINADYRAMLYDEIGKFVAAVSGGAMVEVQRSCPWCHGVDCEHWDGRGYANPKYYRREGNRFVTVGEVTRERECPEI